MPTRILLPKSGLEATLPCGNAQQPNGADKVPKLFLRIRGPINRIYDVYDMPKRVLLPKSGLGATLPCGNVQQSGGAEYIVCV
jgi:hypothetical protein